MTNRQRILCLVLAAPITFAADAASAQAPVIDRTVEGWQITGTHADSGEGICMMEATFQSNSTVAVIKGGASGTTYMFRISNPAWRSIQDGQSYRVRVLFDGEDSYSAPATGSVGPDLDPGIMFNADLSDSTFIGAFGISRGMSVEIDGRRIDGFNLRGTRAAILSLADCIGEVGNAPHYDPFAR